MYSEAFMGDTNCVEYTFTTVLGVNKVNQIINQTTQKVCSDAKWIGHAYNVRLSC